MRWWLTNVRCLYVWSVAAVLYSSATAVAATHRDMMHAAYNGSPALPAARHCRLGHVLERVLKPRSVLALTATATRATQASITTALGMGAGDVVRACPLRDNLRLQVRL